MIGARKRNGTDGATSRIRSPVRKPETANQFPQRPKRLFGLSGGGPNRGESFVRAGDSNPMRTTRTYQGYRGFAMVLGG
jgi:hypothetical protein